MPNGLTYASYQKELVTQLPALQADSNFSQMLPTAIDYAELTICRDLDFLNLHGYVALGNATIGTPFQAVPSGVVLIESLFYGATNTPVVPASQDYIRTVYAGAANGAPAYFAILGAASGAGWTPSLQVLVGPAPDQGYTLTAYGTERQAPLSASNVTTFISANLPDLFWAASMIFWSGYMKDRQLEMPQNAMGWEQEYGRLLKSAMVEEARKKFRAPGFEAEAPAPLAQARM
jgi:hypothetical protein